MLSSMAKEHFQQQMTRKQVLEKKRIKAIEATNKFSQFLVDRLNKEVSEAFINQKKIDAKIKQLNQNTSVFIKQSNQWMHLLENFNTALKELGDVENWSRKIESDMKIINNTLNDILKEENSE